MKLLDTYPISPINNCLYNIHKFQIFNKDEANAIVNEIYQIKLKEDFHWDFYPHERPSMLLIDNRISENYNPKRQTVYSDLYKKYFQKTMKNNFIKIIQKFYFDDITTCDYNVAFIANYMAEGAKNLGLHRDVTLLSCIIQLNDEEKYDGGGTYFQALDKTLKLKQGEMLLFSGKILHSGKEITRGNRIILA